MEIHIGEIFVSSKWLEWQITDNADGVAQFIWQLNGGVDINVYEKLGSGEYKLIRQVTHDNFDVNDSQTVLEATLKLIYGV